MMEPPNQGDKGLRILLEALTTISYLRGQEVRAAAIAEYALNQYEEALRYAGHAEGTANPYLPGLCPEQRNHLALRRAIDRRYIDSGPPFGVAERRVGADRRLSPDRRGQPTTCR